MMVPGMEGKEEVCGGWNWGFWKEETSVNLLI